MCLINGHNLKNWVSFKVRMSKWNKYIDCRKDFFALKSTNNGFSNFVQSVQDDNGNIYKEKKRRYYTIATL